MKTIFYKIRIAILLLSIGICSSCNDFFDVDPENGVRTEDYYKTLNDVNGGALGMYAPLATGVHQFLLWGSARADLVTTGSQSDAYVTEFVNNKITGLNPYTNYSFLYKTIARCNHHLEQIGNVPLSDNTTAKYMEIFYGEAYFLRALCYFYLVRTFNDFPVLTEDISEKVKYVNQNGDTVSMNTLDLSAEELRAIALQPVSKQKVWQLINSDVNKAMALLRTSNQWQIPNFTPPTNSDQYRASLKGAFTLACEVALWLGEYERVSSLADYLLNYCSVGSGSVWYTQFTGNGFSNFSVFPIVYQYTEALETNRLQEFTSNVASDGGKYLLKPILDMVDSLIPDAKDVRRVSWMMVNRQPVIWKYIGKDDKGLSMRDPYQSDAAWQVFKSVDGFILKGIAENRMGNAGAALNFLNYVRRNRGLEEYEKDKISLRMEDLEDLLFKERARETVFEGRRWYDLLLMETTLQRKNILPATVSKKYPADQQAEMYQYLQDPAHWYLPIEPARWK